jgi:hypothetical protein
MGMKHFYRQASVVAVGFSVFFWILTLFSSNAVPVHADDKSAGNARPTAVDSSRKNAALQAVASRLEDLTEFAEAGDAKSVTRTVLDLERQTESIRAFLNPEAWNRFASLMADIPSKRNSNDFIGVALNAVEAYRVLITSLDKQKLKVPAEVGLLDYTGFKLRVLTQQQAPDWQAMNQVALEAGSYWKTIRSKLTDKALQDLVDTTLSGTGQAVEIQDGAMARFAAQVTLDLVDLLEKQFER